MAELTIFSLVGCDRRLGPRSTSTPARPPGAWIGCAMGLNGCSARFTAPVSVAAVPRYKQHRGFIARLVALLPPAWLGGGSLRGLRAVPRRRARYPPRSSECRWTSRVPRVGPRGPSARPVLSADRGLSSAGVTRSRPSGGRPRARMPFRRGGHRFARARRRRRGPPAADRVGRRAQGRFPRDTLGTRPSRTSRSHGARLRSAARRPAPVLLPPQSSSSCARTIAPGTTDFVAGYQQASGFRRRRYEYLRYPRPDADRAAGRFLEEIGYAACIIGGLAALGRASRFRLFRGVFARRSSRRPPRCRWRSWPRLD